LLGIKRVTSARDRPLGESLVVLDESWQQLQVDDGALTGRYQVDDLAHGGGVFVARYHDGAGPDLGRVARRAQLHKDERRQRYP
jgi:hypothetical protein